MFTESFTNYNSQILDLVNSEKDIDKLCDLIKGNLMWHIERAESSRKAAMKGS